MELHLRQDYADDEEARASFVAFLKEIFGLDLSLWRSCGYWDDRYWQHSLFDDDGRVVSSVSVYSVDVIVDGRPGRAAQLSGVGTLPAFRRRGLNRRLTEAALAHVAGDHDFVFLFASDEALPFYDRCGFRQVDQWLPSVTVEPVAPAAESRRLDMTGRSDREELYTAACDGAPVSDLLGARCPKLFMFHALYDFEEAIRHIPELGVYVLAETAGDRCTIHDIVGPTMPSLPELLPYVATEATREVVFGFVPDKLCLGEHEWRRHGADNLCDRFDLPLWGRRFLFPATCHA